MKQKIIILGNGQDWCEKSLKDFEKMDNVKINNYKYLSKLNPFLKFIARIQFAPKINKIIEIPFKSLWYKNIEKIVDAKENEQVIFIIYDRNAFANNEKFLKYLRKQFNNCKLVYMFTNIINITGAMTNGFVSKLNQYYDVVYAFDPVDAKKYNFRYSPLIYSFNEMKVDNRDTVFYVGKAKDRYDMLIKVYERLKALNINSKFYITEVPEEQQIYKGDINYNQYITYEECLKNIQESNCLIDIIQGNSTGFTIKTCEAVYYNKLFITTNKHVKDAPFYDERFMLVIDSASDINKDFFENAKKVEYSEEGKAYFSVKNFLTKLYSDLDLKKEGE